MSFEILLANVRGMCQGVDRAILSVQKALHRYGKQRVWVLHEVVHNTHVVAQLKEQGAHFVESLDEVPKDAVLVLSAHGVGIEIYELAHKRGLTIIDATCPLVSRIHRKMNAAARLGQDAIVIGHQGHQEVIGTIGQYAGDKSRVHVVLTAQDVDALEIISEDLIFATQTTLSVDETAKTVARLKERYPLIKGPLRDDTCNATQERQNAVSELAAICDVVIIAGSKNSSNSNRLAELAQRQGVEAHLIDDASYFDLGWLEEVKTLGLSAGASVPEYVVENIISFLKQHGATSIKGIGKVREQRPFPLPDGL